MATPNIVPRADSEGGLGTASKYWASAYIDLIYVGAGKMGRDADNLIDFSVDDAIFFRVNGSKRVMLNGSRLAPDTTDALQLGGTSNMWSDLFLASGAVINFDNGNVTLTHSNNTLTLADNDILGFGNASDLSIKHTDTAGYIQNTKGHLYINQIADDKDIIFQSDDGSGSYVPYLTLDGGLGYTVANKDIYFAPGIRAYFGSSGNLSVVHDNSNGNIINTTGDLTIKNQADDSDIIFQSDDGSGGTTTYFALDGADGGTRFYRSLIVQDNVGLAVGSALDFSIEHNGTDTTITESTGDLTIRNTANDKDIKFQCDNGDSNLTTYFYLDGSSATHDGSATTGLYTNWPDKSVISLGTSHDLRIYHDGTNSKITNHVGNLDIIQTTDDADITFQCDDGSGGHTSYLTLDGGLGYTTVHKHFKFDDNAQVQLGTGSDFRLYHTGSTSFVMNYVGDVRFINYQDDGDFKFETDNGSGGTTEYLRIDGGAGYTIASKTINWLDGVYGSWGTSGDFLIFHDGTNSYLSNSTGDLYIKNNADDAGIIFQSDNGAGGTATYFKLDGATSIHNTALYTNWPDNSRITLGSSHDIYMYHDGANTWFENQTGDLTFRNSADDKDIIFQSDDGSGGTTTYLTLDGGDGRIKIPDSKIMQFGAGGDLQLQHDATNSSINNYTGDLVITNNADNRDIIFKSDDGSGGTETYFFLDGSASSGPFTAFPDSSILTFGADRDLQIYHDGNHSYMSHGGTGKLFIQQSTNDQDIVFQCDDNSGGETEYFRLDGSEGHMIASKELNFADGVPVTFGDKAGGDLEIKESSGSSYIMNYTGNLEIINNTNDGDIIFKSDDGSGGTETYFFLDGSNGWTTFPDSKKATFGTGNDLQIYHDGSNSYISDTGTGSLILQSSDLFLRTNSTENAVVCAANAGVTLYYDNAAKLATTSTGVDITGGLTTTSTVILSNLPTSDPGTTGQLWNDNGTLKISAGG